VQAVHHGLISGSDMPAHNILIQHATLLLHTAAL